MGGGGGGVMAGIHTLAVTMGQLAVEPTHRRASGPALALVGSEHVSFLALALSTWCNTGAGGRVEDVATGAC